MDKKERMCLAAVIASRLQTILDKPGKIHNDEDTPI